MINLNPPSASKAASEASKRNDGEKNLTLPQRPWTTIRASFVQLIEAWLSCGGELSAGCMRKVLNILRTLLREGGAEIFEITSIFTKQYVESILSSDIKAPIKAINTLLQELSPIFGQYINQIDFAPFLNCLSQIIKSKSGSVVRILRFNP